MSVATGAGKTMFAMMCMAELVERHPTANHIIIVPTIALADQWYLALEESLPAELRDIAVHSGAAKDSAAHRFNIVLINTARSWAPSACAAATSCLVVDECHRAGAPANSRALHGSYLSTLGLSATPWREYDDGFARWVAPALGDVVYEYDYADALRDGVVVPFDIVNVRVNLLDDEQRRYDGLTATLARVAGNAGAPPDDEAVRAVLRRRARLAARAAMRIPTAVRLAERHRNEQCIVFHESTKDADSIARILNERGVYSAVYHTASGESARRDNLRLFLRGVVRCLVACRALDEGANVPEASVAIVASATASARQRIQRIGRVLRPAPRKDRAVVYTVYATTPEEQRLVREASDLEGVASVAWFAAWR